MLGQRPLAGLPIVDSGQVSVILVGVAAAGVAASLVSRAIVSFTGVSAGTAASLSPTVAPALTGVAAGTAVGSFAREVDKPISGVAAAAAVRR
jgi:hypothetical protein